MIVASQWCVDPGAEAAFDAPKRLVVVAGIAAATMLLGGRAIAHGVRCTLGKARTGMVVGWAPVLVCAALVWALLSALVSPRVAVALDGWRLLALGVAWMGVGASRLLDGSRGPAVLAAFWTASGVTALLTILQSLGWIGIFEVERLGGRGMAFALLGNEGLVGLVMALAATSLCAVLAHPQPAETRFGRAAMAALLILSLAALGVTGNLTGWLALAGGLATVVVVRFRSRAIGIAMAGAIGFAVAVGAVAPLRHRVETLVTSARHGDWTSALTYRPIAWRSAIELARQRPLVGFGPGTFEVEFIPGRVAAEERLGRRLANPNLEAHFAMAHDDYLEGVSTIGLLGSGAALAALALTLVRLARIAAHASSDDSSSDARPVSVCLAMATAGAISALTWFPLESPATSVPLLLALGRGWRLAMPEDGSVDEEGGGQDVARVWPGRVALGLIVALALPEVPRFSGEHAIARASAVVQAASTSSAFPPAPSLLRMATESACAAERWIPGDTRGLVTAGAAALFQGDPAKGLDLYARAFARSERAEIDLDLGRAYAMLDRRPEALAAFVRAVWLSPALESALPEAARPLVAREVARREAALAAREASAIPPPPPLPASPAS